MKFARVDGERREAKPGLSGECPGCGAAVFAKCGEVKVWHWAHKGNRSCDPWSEPETAWHRAWKNQFPVAWQEVPMRAEDGELHIADVRTPSGLVLEFQHSPIKPDERRSREAFYGSMLWIVDGTRLKRDAPRVDSDIFGWRKLSEGALTLLGGPEWALPKAWIECDVPVLFDFDGLSRREDFPGERDGLPPSVMREQEWWASRGAIADPLFCLLPRRFDGRAVYFTLQRETLPRIALGEVKPPDWQEAHSQLKARYPDEHQPPSRQRFTNHRNWPWR
jgi:competence protein CoiA